MSRLKKITLLYDCQIIYVFVIFLPCLFFITLRLSKLDNINLLIIYFFLFVGFSMFPSCLIIYIFVIIPLKKYSLSGRCRLIPVHLSINKNIPNLKIDNISTIYYKKRFDLYTISVHKLEGVNYEKCTKSILNTTDKILNIFPTAIKFGETLFFWQVRVNLIFYEGDEDVSKLCDLVKKLNNDDKYEQRNFCCVYYKKKELLIIREFDNKIKAWDMRALALYRLSLKKICKFYGLVFKDLVKYL